MTIPDFRGLRVLVAGEVGIDEYLWGDASRVSPEAPVPVVELDRQTFHLGMAGNVAQNLAALGATPVLVSVVGRDRDADHLKELLAGAGVTETVLLEDESRPTLKKTRVVARRQHVVRLDREKRHRLAPTVARAFHDAMTARLAEVDAIIVEDYGKGLWNFDTMAFVGRAAALGKPVFVDPNKSTPLAVYRGATLLTPNLDEAAALAKIEIDGKAAFVADEAKLTELGHSLLAGTDAEHAVITLGEWGMASLSQGESQAARIPTFAREVFDVTGAGDTVIAVVALAYTRGLPLAECLRLANLAAGIVVGHVGTRAVTAEELVAAIEAVPAGGDAVTPEL
jgi:D-beta-D-heptose 7-phosphate kinase/D-beta-D-heptose 1-phosphate adenosyltransferase